MKTDQKVIRTKIFSVVITLFFLLAGARFMTPGNVVVKATANKPHLIKQTATTPTYTFNASAQLYQNTQFVLYVNGVAITGDEDIISGSPLTLYDYNAVNSNSTVVVDVVWGHIPTLSVLEGPFPAVYGVVSGNTITFSHVPLTTGGSCGLILN
jgi:hypothetical protein